MDRNSATYRLLMDAMAVAYAHKEFELFQRIQKHLAELERQG